jgi:opacity protein-like surface antigen
LAGYSSYSAGSYSASGFSWGVRGGVKVLVVQHVIIQVGVQYIQVTENPSGVTSRYGYNELLVGAGFSVWL